MVLVLKAEEEVLRLDLKRKTTASSRKTPTRSRVRKETERRGRCWWWRCVW
jgi:hypothetical protein